MIDATIVRAHQPSTGLEKKEFERSDGPLARRIDDQDHARRCAGQSTGGEPHRRTCPRRSAGPILDPGKSNPQPSSPTKATASSSISKSAASSLSLRRGQIAKTPRERDLALYCESNLAFLQHHQAPSRHRNPLRKTARNFLAGVHLVCALAWLK